MTSKHLAVLLCNFCIISTVFQDFLCWANIGRARICTNGGQKEIRVFLTSRKGVGLNSDWRFRSNKMLLYQNQSNNVQALLLDCNHKVLDTAQEVPFTQHLPTPKPGPSGNRFSPQCKSEQPSVTGTLQQPGIREVQGSSSHTPFSLATLSLWHHCAAMPLKSLNLWCQVVQKDLHVINSLFL